VAKETGLGDGLLVDGVDLSGDVGSLGRINAARATTDVTGINKSAFERRYIHKDGGIDFQGWFNPTGLHPEISTLPRTDRIATYLRGVGSGRPAASTIAKQLNYDPTRNADGSLTLATTVESNSFGVDWGIQLTNGIITQTSAGSTTGIDFGSSTLFGAQAFVHVTAFTGTSITITLEHSTDDGAGDAYAAIPGGAFTVVSAAPASQRIQTSRTQTIEDFVRVTTTGTFSNAQFIVLFTRNLTSVVF